MIEEGAPAPGFDLPAVVEEEQERVALEDYCGQAVVILAFYPGDFNPAGDDGSTDLDELDLFTIQNDVAVLGISADSVYSHRAFADEYDLHVPLLSDVRGEVAADYGVAVGDPTAGHLVHRAVVVVGLDGDVEFAWSTENLEELLPLDAVRNAVDSVGGDRAAEARYGVGHAHYIEGRRQFTSAMDAFTDEEWLMADWDFEQAEEEFSEAADEFNTAVRFAEDQEKQRYFERAEDKAEALWRAAEWLAESANAFAGGEGAKGMAMRDDAENPLEEARDINDPIHPDEFPPEEDPAPAEVDGDADDGILPSDDEETDASLEIDVEEAAGPDGTVDLADDERAAGVGHDGEDDGGTGGAETGWKKADAGASGVGADSGPGPVGEGAEGGTATGSGSDAAVAGGAGADAASAESAGAGASGATAAGDTDSREGSSDDTETSGSAGEGPGPDGANGDGEGEDGDGSEIDVAELEEITAAVEEQTEKANAEREATTGPGEDGGAAVGDADRPDDGGPAAAASTGLDDGDGPDGSDRGPESVDDGARRGDGSRGATGGDSGRVTAADAAGGTGGSAGPGDASGETDAAGEADAGGDGPAHEGHGAGSDSDTDLEEGDIELDLTDPSDGEDELVEPSDPEQDAEGITEAPGGHQGDEEDSDRDGPGDGDGDLGDGDHGVPDSR